MTARPVDCSFPSSSRPEETPDQVASLQAEIRRLARSRKAVVLAHNYQRPEVQDVADYVGDSLGLSRQAAATEASVIIFCGVHFMAETAAILSPQKRVLLPDLRAGCSLAATITAEDVRQWKAKFPGYIAVGYVNTTAEVKAELDYCCTSGNVLDVIDAIPADQGILFLPDFFLGSHVRRMRPERRIEVWMGECHVHKGIRPEVLNEARAAYPEAEVLVHPECGCAGQLIYSVGRGDIEPDGLHITSTEGMIRTVTQRPAKQFIVATETGIMHRMQSNTVLFCPCTSLSLGIAVASAASSRITSLNVGFVRHGAPVSRLMLQRRVRRARLPRAISVARASSGGPQKRRNCVQPRVDLGQRARVDGVDAPRALGAHRREPALAQDLELLRDRRLRDAELPAR